MKAKVENLKKEQRETLKVSLTFDTADVQLVHTPYGMIVEMEDCPPSGEPGGPGLPSKIIRLALPELKYVADISAEVKKKVRLTKKPEFLAPLQLPLPGVTDDQTPGKRQNNRAKKDVSLKPSFFKAREETFIESYTAPAFQHPRVELYEEEIKRPRPMVHLVKTEQAGPLKIAVIEIAPIRMNEKGLLELASEIEVIVSYAQKQTDTKRTLDSSGLEISAKTDEIAPPIFHRQIHSRAQAERLIELTRDKVLNPEDIWDFSPFFPEFIAQVDYLVITDNHTWDETSVAPVDYTGDLVQSFQKLVDWKAKRGLKSRVVTVNNIVDGRYGSFSNGARDLQEVIRNFLKWAHSAWGVSWVLLGGDVNIVPARHVAGASEGHINTESIDPPEDNRSFWTGTFLKMKVESPGTWWPGNSIDHRLVRADNGLLIPYDATGTSGPTQNGWYFCTDDSYATRTQNPTKYVRVNGQANDINTRLQWLYKWNTLPTDLYYSSLQGPNYDQPGLHDWDLLDNGIYGQHTNNADFDGIDYETDMSVGRVPVSTEAQANAFVNKVIAYEQFRQPDGSPLDTNWTKKMLLVSSNWGGRIWLPPTGSTPPGDNRYHHVAGEAHTLLKLKKVPSDLKWQLIVQVASTDLRLMPYDHEASATKRGWYYARSDSDLSPSGAEFGFIGISFFIPIPTEWVVVYGPDNELTPEGYIFDRNEPDGSLRDQEVLREQVDSELSGITSFSRLYQDDIDLTQEQRDAAPVEHLTEDRLRDALNSGSHFVSLSGHGNSDGCCKLSGNMAQNLTNGYHTFIAYADSCLTNQFDAEDAVSERLLYNPNGGAVAYIGNTRFSWIGVGDNFQRAFYHRLTSTRHLGLLNDSRVGMVNESTGFYRLYTKWAIFTLNLMGDPEMPIWKSKPKTFTVSFDRVVDKRAPFIVKVKKPSSSFMPWDTSVHGAVVHIQQGDFVHTATTDILGQAFFNINSAELGQLEITVTKMGYQPYFGEARIAGPAWVSGRVTQIVHQEGSPHRSLVRLHLRQQIDSDEYRGWYAYDSKKDYGIILDAVTDAYVGEKSISLFVNLIDEGGAIERFSFGYGVEIPYPLPPHIIGKEYDTPELVVKNMEKVEDTRKSDDEE